MTDGAGPFQPPTPTRPHRARAFLALVLLLCIALPAAILALGPDGGPVATTVEAAATLPSESSTEAATAPSTTEAPTTTEATTTSAEDESTTTTTAAPSTTTTAAPTTTSTTAPKAALKAQLAPTTTAAPTTTTTAAPTTTARPTTTVASASSSDLAFLACVRQRESGGNYSIVSADGTYRGAYQFAQATWDSAVTSAGRPDLRGVPVNQVTPADQDAIALWVVQHWGRGPWSGVCY